MEQILRNNKFDGTSYFAVLKEMLDGGTDLYLVFYCWEKYIDDCFRQYIEGVSKVRFVDRSYVALTKDELIQSLVKRHMRQ